MMISVFVRVENIVRKGENAGYQHSLRFPQCFQKASFSRLLKVGIVWERVKLIVLYHTNKILDMLKLRVFCRYREYVYSAVVYQKYLTRLRELIIFEPWRENYHFSQPR